MAVQTLTITRTILGINPIGNNIWQIEFNPSQTQITSDSSAAPVIYYSSSALPVVLNPYLNNIGNWNTNDYNAIMNNADGERLSTFYKQVDYSTAQTVPVNFEAIISGTAYPAAIQDSNYTSNWYTIPRYIGSKNTTDNFNTSLISASLFVQNYQKSNIGATTLGEPSVNKYDVGILEFNWGGGIYPEIQEAGALSLNQLFLVGGNRDAVTIFGAQQTGFITASSLEFPLNLSPTFYQYNTNVTTTVGTSIAAYGFSTPAVANYFIPANSPSGAGFDGDVINLFSSTRSFFQTATNNSGYYVTSSVSSSAQNIVSEISSSLTLGDRWFISIYKDLNSPINNTYLPYIDIYGPYLYPNTQAYNLGQLGVYEIVSTTGTTILRTNISASALSLSIGIGGGDAYGGLIWKAIKGEYMILTGNTLSGLGKGALLGPSPSPVVEDNLRYITRAGGDT
jgi:hypothetical protein